MKKIAIFLIAALLPLSSLAQSSMTDSQVAAYVQKEMKRGTSQAQIVTHLMQSGVDISQIRRVRRSYEQQMRESSTGSVSGQSTNRLRQNNSVSNHTGKGNAQERYATESADRRRDATSTQRLQGVPQWQEQYNEDDADFRNFQNEVGAMVPDTLAMVGRYKGHKVFGRDIFSNKNLSFDPVMNIATPQNYVLGAGDEVTVDIYGASQKSVSSTITPDGDIVI